MFILHFTGSQKGLKNTNIELKFRALLCAGLGQLPKEHEEDTNSLSP